MIWAHVKYSGSVRISFGAETEYDPETGGALSIVAFPYHNGSDITPNISMCDPVVRSYAMTGPITCRLYPIVIHMLRIMEIIANMMQWLQIFFRKFSKNFVFAKPR